MLRFTRLSQFKRGRRYGQAFETVSSLKARVETANSSVPPYIRNAPRTEVSTLENKLKVATEYRGGEMVTLGLWIDSGSMYETEANNGVAHFMEHLVFKGTPSRSGEQLVDEIENMGGKLNAYTARDGTAYFAQVFRKDVGKAVEIISDVVMNSTFSAAHVEAERGVILREMEEVEKDPKEALFDHLHSTAFQGSPLGYTILGPEANVRSLTRDDMVKFAQTHYTAPRMSFVAVGNVQHDEVARAVEKSLGRVSSEVHASAADRPATDFVGSAAFVRDDAYPQVHVAVALEGCSVTDPNYFAFMVMQSLVGNFDRSLGVGRNLTSRLGELLATEGLAHSLMSFNTCYHDTGLFGAYLVAEKDKTTDAVFETMNEWRRLSLSVSPFEVECAKAKLKQLMLKNSDGSCAVADEIGRHMIAFGRRMSTYEMLRRIDEVDHNMVRSVAYDYLIDSEPAVAAIGPVDNAILDYNIIRDWTHHRRL